MSLIRTSSALGGLSNYSLADDVYLTAGELTLPVHPRILRTYLPALAEYSTASLTGIINLNRLAFQSHAYTKYPWFRDTMLDMLETLLRSLSRSIHHSEAPSLELTTFLEDSLHDTYSSRILQHRYALTYQRFFCLAFVGKHAASDRIQALLSQFFVRYGGRLLRVEDDEFAVYEWCRVIAMYINPADRVGCLREAIAGRKSILRDLRLVHRYRPSRDTVAMLRIVEDMLDRMLDGYEPFEMRGRSRQRFERYRQDVWRPREATFQPVRSYSTSPPRHRRILSPPSYGRDDSVDWRTNELVPYGVRDVVRRAMSQSDQQRIKRLETRLSEAEDAIAWVAARQIEKDGVGSTARSSARRIWSNTEDLY